VEEALAKTFEVFEVGFADFTEEETVEAGDALTVVGPDLGEEPVSFAAAASAAIADGAGAVRIITEPSGRAGRKLPGLEEEAGANKVLHLIARTASKTCSSGEMVRQG